MSLISKLSNHIWDIFQIDLWSYYLFFWLSKHRHSFHPILCLKLWPKPSYYDPVAHANDIQHLLGTLQENLETQVYQDRLSYRKDIYVLGWRHIDIITAINVVANEWFLTSYLSNSNYDKTYFCIPSERWSLLCLL